MEEGKRLRAPALDPMTVAPSGPTTYPEPFRALVARRERRRLGDALGLKNFGVNLLRLPPGCGSSQRHWHSCQDEFVYVVAGKVALVTDGGEQLLTVGMAAGFPAGKPDGHHLINRSAADALVLEVGDRTPGDEADYSDIDMLVRLIGGKARYVRKDGTPY